MQWLKVGTVVSRHVWEPCVQLPLEFFSFCEKAAYNSDAKSWMLLKPEYLFMVTLVSVCPPRLWRHSHCLLCLESFRNRCSCHVTALVKRIFVHVMSQIGGKWGQAKKGSNWVLWNDSLLLLPLKDERMSAGSTVFYTCSARPYYWELHCAACRLH